MHSIKNILRRAALYLMVVVLASGSPLTFAEDTSTKPPGDGPYTYDASTQHWNSQSWRWDPVAGKYVPTASPSPSTSPTTSDTASPSPSPSPDTTTTEKTNEAAPAASVAPTGGSANVTDNTNGSATTNVNTGAQVTNNLGSNATTGTAGVTHNLSAGNAITGDANAGTTTINSVHSTVGDPSGNPDGIAHFTMNLYGDITGDITIGPNIQNATVDKNTTISSNTNVNNNDTLTNNLNLNANSGDANVSGNTSGGSATSGNANTVANVLNLINSLIAANKSFEGTINIYGNLNGDILVSPDFIPQLLASNAEVYGNYTMPLSTNVNDDQSIVNNVKLNATTGSATVANNTSAGTAQTGTAQTNLTILNLTGHKVVAKQSLLVFVNVLGKWVGMIVDAPGATSAALGNGVVSDNVTLANTTNLNNQAKIVNNLDLSSHSGDATVAGNTKGGNATSGDATASANIANISTSEFNLSDWFGVLFINVFGTWVGSFGIDTAAGTVIPLSGDALPQASPAVAGAPNLRFGYRGTPHTGTTFLPAGGTGTGTDFDNTNPAYAAVLASAMKNGGSGAVPDVQQPPLIALSSPHIDPFSTLMMVTGLSILGGSGVLWAIRRWMAFRGAVL